MPKQQCQTSASETQLIMNQRQLISIPKACSQTPHRLKKKQFELLKPWKPQKTKWKVVKSSTAISQSKRTNKNPSHRTLHSAELKNACQQLRKGLATILEACTEHCQQTLSLDSSMKSTDTLSH